MHGKSHVFNEIFVEIANLVHKITKSSPSQNFANIVKKFKAEKDNVLLLMDPYSLSMGRGEANFHLLDGLVGMLFAYATNNSMTGQNSTSVNDLAVPLYEDEISDPTLETAAKILLHMMTPQETYWVEWYSKYESFLGAKPHSLRRILSKYKRKHFEITAFNSNFFTLYFLPSDHSRDA